MPKYIEATVHEKNKRARKCILSFQAIAYEALKKHAVCESHAEHSLSPMSESVG